MNGAYSIIDRIRVLYVVSSLDSFESVKSALNSLYYVVDMLAESESRIKSYTEKFWVPLALDGVAVYLVIDVNISKVEFVIVVSYPGDHVVCEHA